MPTARCLLMTAPGAVAVATTEIPEAGPGEVLVRAAWTCVSPGTELRCLAGRQEGAPPFPFIPGYALAGRVAACGEGVTGVAPGAPVFCSGTRRAAHARCWGGHVELAVIPAEDLVPVPAGLTLRAAAGAKLAAIAYHGLRLSAPQPHERVFVIGLGPIGRLSAELHALAGAEVWVTDLSARRRSAAAAAGLRIADSAETFPAGGADIVVDATGAAPVLATAARLLRPRPWDQQLHAPRRLLVQGSYAAPPPLPYNELFMTEAQVLVPRDSQRLDVEAVLRLAASGRLDLAAIVSDGGAPADASAIYHTLRDRPDELVTAAFRWSDQD